jgi:peptidoglycan/LPS O-acetylase OafA/YrhL
MLGTFRLILALLVALSHAGVAIAGFNPGVVAVVCFYLISGYVMTGLLRDHYPDVRRIPHFYLDRALRLFPQYLVVAGLTLAWFVATGKHTAFLQHDLHRWDLFANLTVVPLNYFMFIGTDQFTLIPPAWSLGAEIQFYLLIPLLLLFRLRTLAFLVGLAVFGAAAWGRLHTDTFGYRLLPGVLVFFLMGAALYDARNTSRTRGMVIVAAGVLAAITFGFVLSHFGRLMSPYNPETLIGIVIGLPLVYWLGKLPQQSLDNRLGDLSYGVFLNHFLIQWAFVGRPDGALEFAGYLAASLALSMLTQRLVERPVLRWRRNLRAQREGF